MAEKYKASMKEVQKEEGTFKDVCNGVNKFSTPFFKYVEEETLGNMLSSPVGAAILLSLVSSGARGETKDQFKKLLHLPEPESRAYTGYGRLIRKVNAIEGNPFLFTINVFVTAKYPVNPTYKELAEAVTDIFKHTVLRSVDFKRNEQAASTINTLIVQHTTNRINDVVLAGDVSDVTSMVLVNTIYFKGLWDHAFDTWCTEHMPFHLTNHTSENVVTMHRKGDYRYGELPDINARFVEIPYKEKQLTMVVIVPNEIDGLPKIEAKLHNADLASILQDGYSCEVRLYLPKFKVEKHMEFSRVLKKMGLNDAFDDNADFSVISDGPLKIDKVVQKTVIVVEEKGDKPSSPKKTGFVPYVEPLTDSSIIFKVDRPSYFAIYHRDYHFLLFNGLLMFP